MQHREPSLLRSSSLASTLTLLAALLATAGCQRRDVAPLNPCTRAGVQENVKVTPIEEVDLLFMMDNSNSMAAEQAAIAREIPRMVLALASGDADADGTQDFPPVRSLNIGVVTSDLGDGGNGNSTCTVNSDRGGDGILRDRGNPGQPGCQASYTPNFFTFRPAAMTQTPEQFAADVSCVAVLGTNGCGLEQQLDAALKALTPSTSSIRFTSVSPNGHADGQNAGFLRTVGNNDGRESLLAILMITDEDDCSTPDPANFFRPGDDLNVRCSQAPGNLYNVQRYVDGFMSLRQDPDLLLFAGIVGIPAELSWDREGPTPWDTILNHDRMRIVLTSNGLNLEPSCRRPVSGGPDEIAYPPRRIVEVARGLEERGANVTLSTICQDDYSDAIQGIIDKIADVLSGTCLPRALTADASGLVGCDVVETLSATGETTRCSEIQGREFLRNDVDALNRTVEVCRVNQLAVTWNTAPSGAGWYYDDFSPAIANCSAERQQRITYTVPPVAGTSVRLECLTSAADSSGMNGATVGTSCADNRDICNNASIDDRELFNDEDPLDCQDSTNTCQPVCVQTSDCAGGWSCVDGWCVNPTCGG